MTAYKDVDPNAYITALARGMANVPGVCVSRIGWTRKAQYVTIQRNGKCHGRVYVYRRDGSLCVTLLANKVAECKGIDERYMPGLSIMPGTLHAREIVALLVELDAGNPRADVGSASPLWG